MTNLRKIDTTTNDTVVNTPYVAKPTDLSLLEYIIVGDYKLDLFSQNDYLTRIKGGATVTTGAPTHYTEMNNKYYFYPTPNAALNVEYYYYKVPALIEDLSTEIDNVFVPVLIYYCGSSFAEIRGNDKRSDKLYTKFEKLLEQLCVEFSGPESADAESVEQTSFISTELDFLN